MQEQEFHSVRIPSCFEEADDLSNRIAEEANKCGYEEDSVFALRLSLEEALANAILHGNVRDESKHIRVRYQVTPERIDLYVADEGDGFNPTDVPDPTLPENLQRPTGRGIMLMRSYMTLVEYNDRGNEVHMVRVNRAS